MSVGQMSVGQISVGQMSVRQMSFGQRSVGQMSVGQRSVRRCGVVTSTRFLFDTTLLRPITGVSLHRLPILVVSLNRLTLASLPTSLPNDIGKYDVTSTTHKTSVVR